MSWLFSRALGVESWEESCSGGEQSAQSSATPTPQAYWSPGKTTDTCPRFRSGMTCEVLTADRGAAVLTWFREGFRVKTFRRLAKALVLTANEADYGESSRESLARYDRDSCSWKTRQFSLAGDLVEYSETWPRWGSMRSGVSFRRQTPSGLLAIRASITSGNAYGSLLPTPTDASKGGGNSRSGERRDEIPSLQGMALAGKIPTPRAEERQQHNSQDAGMALSAFVKLPTPRASDGEKGGPNQRGSKGDAMLPSAVMRLPTATVRDRKEDAENRHGGMRLGVAIRSLATPTARDWKSGKASQATMDRNSRPLSEQVGGQLNPSWVEWLMGWPVGWTDSAPLATDKFQQWRHAHGEYCIDD